MSMQCRGISEHGERCTVQLDRGERCPRCGYCPECRTQRDPDAVCGCVPNVCRMCLEPVTAESQCQCERDDELCASGGLKYGAERDANAALLAHWYNHGPKLLVAMEHIVDSMEDEASCADSCTRPTYFRKLVDAASEVDGI